MALSDSMVAVDLRMVEEFAKADLKDRTNTKGGEDKLDACLLEKSKAGLWYVYALVESADCDIDESRVSGLICLADSSFDIMMTSTEYLLGLPWTDVEVKDNSLYSGKVAVSCGTLGFMCVESIRRSVKVHGVSEEENNAFVDFIRSWANAMCQATTTSSKVLLSNVPNGPIGAISSVGVCDNGRYTCQIIKDEVTDEVWAFKVMFPVQP